MPDIPGLQGYVVIEAEAPAKISKVFSFTEASTYPISTIILVNALFNHTSGLKFLYWGSMMSSITQSRQLVLYFRLWFIRWQTCPPAGEACGNWPIIIMY